MSRTAKSRNTCGYGPGVIVMMNTVPDYGITSVYSRCLTTNIILAAFEVSVVISDYILLTLGEIWDQQGKFQPLHESEIKEKCR